MADKSEMEVPLFPVTGWEIGPVVAHEVIMIRPAFVSGALQKLSESDPGRRYVLTPVQARELVAGIERALGALESAGPQAGPGSRH